MSPVAASRMCTRWASTGLTCSTQPSSGLTRTMRQRSTRSASSATAGMCCRSSSSARTRVSGNTCERQAAERGLAGAVHILGFVSDEELVALYQHAHALLYLSRFGPENLPPLEAFALGCPAIVEDVCGCERAAAATRR